MRSVVLIHGLSVCPSDRITRLAHNPAILCGRHRQPASLYKRSRVASASIRAIQQHVSASTRKPRTTTSSSDRVATNFSLS